jgi:DNA-directed RNA polymerase specialized sigma subunit
MTAKEYLSQAWQLKMRIESMTEMLAFLQSAAKYSSPQFSDMPKPPQRNIHKTEDAIIRVMDFEEKIQTERDKLSGVMAIITNIGDATAQAIVVKRYIDRKTWNDIADETYASLRQVHRIHQTVLDEMTAKLKDGTV